MPLNKLFVNSSKLLMPSSFISSSSNSKFNLRFLGKISLAVSYVLLLITFFMVKLPWNSGSNVSSIVSL